MQHITNYIENKQYNYYSYLWARERKDLVKYLSNWSNDFKISMKTKNTMKTIKSMCLHLLFKFIGDFDQSVQHYTQ